MEADNGKALPEVWPIKLSCVTLMLGSGAIALTGRGMISIVQGIVGVVVAVEGFWAGASYDAAAVRRLIKFMFVYALVSFVVGLVHFGTVAEYCVDESGSRRDTCEAQAEGAALAIIVAGAVVVPTLACIQYWFYTRLQKADRSHVMRAQAARRRLFYSTFDQQ